LAVAEQQYWLGQMDEFIHGSNRPRLNHREQCRPASSAPGASFAIETGVSLEDWSELANGLAAGDADTTTYQFEMAEPVSDVLFMRVRRE
jgi:hypothetical protein